MKLRLHNHTNDETETFEVNSREDLLKLAKQYPKVYKMVESAPVLEDGLAILAKYLSSHHMDAKIVPDKQEKIFDDINVSGARKPKEIKNLNDAARLLESDEEEVDIPEGIVLEGSTHRW